MLSDIDRETYSWQINIPGFSEAVQETLKNTTALVSRVGGMGGSVALSLAAAGIGKIVLAHKGKLRQNDLNRQILMSSERLDKPRVLCAKDTLRRFNSNIEIITYDENVSYDNAHKLLNGVDIAFGCAPIFKERYSLNDYCINQKIPLIDCSMYSMEGRVISIKSGNTPCLRCIYPEEPLHWKRKFPVLGAVSSLVAQIGVLEGIKILTNFRKPSYGQMVCIDADNYKIEKISLNSAKQNCSTCSY